MIQVEQPVTVSLAAGLEFGITEASDPDNATAMKGGGRDRIAPSLTTSAMRNL